MGGQKKVGAKKLVETGVAAITKNTAVKTFKVRVRRPAQNNYLRKYTDEQSRINTRWALEILK